MKVYCLFLLNFQGTIYVFNVRSLSIYDYQKGDFHSFFKHYHMKKMDSRKSRVKFQEEINSYFFKTGLLYKLSPNDEVERIIVNDIVTPDIEQKIQNISEKGTKELLEEAILLHKSHSPNAPRDSVEKIWDAFERLKTYYVELNKKQSTEKIINQMANGSNDFYQLFEEEFNKLRYIGNNYRIRHHETDKIEINDINYYDYLFSRCLILITLATHYLK